MASMQVDGGWGDEVGCVVLDLGSDTLKVRSDSDQRTSLAEMTRDRVRLCPWKRETYQANESADMINVETLAYVMKKTDNVVERNRRLLIRVLYSLFPFLI